MKRDLYSTELSQLFDKFVREMNRLNRADNPKLICRLITKWTKGQLLLTKKLLQYLLEVNKRITLGQEAAVVEKIIRTRLIREFKQDELTLPIRKLLYARDLIRLLTRTGGKINYSERVYLGKLQQEFGLSEKQCQQIKEQYLRSQLAVNLKVDESSSIVRIEPESDQLNNSYQDLIELLESSPIYEELIAEDRLPPQVIKPAKVNRFGNRKFWVICLGISLLLLIFRQIDWQKSWRSATAVNNVNSTSSCVNNLVSPQMSLGTKLLSPTESNQSDSQINLYRATTAMAGCEYEVAQTEFQQALNLDEGNSEALIYLNNTKAIANNSMVANNLKIAVTVSFDRQLEVTKEILQGVALAQTEINNLGGINSQPLLIQLVNLPPEQDFAAEIVRELAADETILAVIGHDSGNAHMQISEIYQREELLMIFPVSTNPNLDRVGDRILRLTPDLSSMVDTLHRYAVVSSLNKIAVCADSRDSDSSFFARKFTSKIESSGGEIATLNCNLAEKNFNPVPLVQQAIAQNADAILLAPSYNSIDRAIAIAQTNQQRLALLGNHILYTDKTLHEGQAAVADMVLTTPWLPIDFTKDKNAKTNWRTAMSYNATLAIVQGLKQSSDRQELIAVLNNPSFTVEGAVGKIQFANQNKSQVRLAYVDRRQNTQPYQFLPLKIEQ